MFLSSLGLISSSIVAHLAVRVLGYELPNQARMTRQMYLQNVVPVGICQAATLALGNSVYMFLTVSFIQMLKAFTPVMVLAVGVLFQVEASEPRVGLGGREGREEGREGGRRREMLIRRSYRNNHLTNPSLPPPLASFLLFLDYYGRDGHLSRYCSGLVRRNEFQPPWNLLDDGRKPHGSRPLDFGPKVLAISAIWNRRVTVLHGACGGCLPDGC